MVIDSVNWLAWRPLRAELPDLGFCVKLTTLRLDHNLPQIPRDALVFKVESRSSGPGGEHIYVKHQDLVPFLKDFQDSRRSSGKVLHAVYPSHNQTVLDIDIKQDEYADYWHFIKDLPYKHIERAVHSIRDRMLPLCSLDTE